MADAAWFETVSHETVYRGYSIVHRDQVRMPDGATVDREYVEHDDAVAVVPVLPDGSVLLLKQYRHPVGRYVLELPAGKLDVEGEAAESAARRELVEEVDHEADELQHLVTFENSAGWTTERTSVYLARDVRPVDPPATFQPEAEEADMEIVRIPVADAVAMARAGELTDAKTVVGLLLAAPHLGLEGTGGQ